MIIVRCNVQVLTDLMDSRTNFEGNCPLSAVMLCWGVPENQINVILVSVIEWHCNSSPNDQLSSRSQIKSVK